MKKSYKTPALTAYGKMEQLTQGSGFGLIDLFVVGLSDPIGNCGGGSCAQS